MRNVSYLIRLARQGWDHRDWYTRAEGSLMDLSDFLDIDFDELVDVLSITSPRVSVARNVRVTIDYFKTGTLSSGLIKSTHAALKHYRRTGEIRGPKTSKFAAALKGDTTAIVLDTWMAKALGIPQSSFSNKRVRSSVERRIRYGAYILGITPAEFQAAVWSGIVMNEGRLSVPCITQVLNEEMTR